MTLKKRKHWLHMADGGVDGVIVSCFNLLEYVRAFAWRCWGALIALRVILQGSRSEHVSGHTFVNGK